ncbi:trigger factor [Chloroflexota bacterium]
MKVTNDKTENSQAYLTIEMEPEEVEKSLDSAYKKLVKNARVPGFRKGKAPRDIFERYVGKESLLEEAINNLVPQAYEDALKEQELEAIAQPEIELSQTEPLIFTAVVPLKPSVTLGNYHSINIKPDKVEVNDSNVDEVIEQLRHQYATWEPAERAVELDDMVTFDVESSVEDETYISQKGAQYQVVSGQAFPAPGFPEQLVGIAKGEEKEIKLTLPEENMDEKYAGKEAVFKITVNEIKQEVLPELTDAFAAEVDAEFKTMKALRERAMSDLKQRAEERVKADFEEKVVDAVIDVSKLEYPPILVHSEIHRIIDQRFQGRQQEIEQYLMSINKTEEDLHEELEPVAEKTVSRSLVLGKVMEEEDIKVEDDEIQKEIETIAEGSGDNKESMLKILDTPQARETIEQRLITRKTLELLTDIAKSTKRKKKKTDKEEKDE